MATLYTHKENNIAKTWLLMVLFLGAVIGIGWAISWYFQSSIILYIAIAIALVMNITSYWFSDKMVIKMSGAKPIDEDKHREYKEIIENLAITSGLPEPKLYVIDDPAPNAFATGRNPQHAAIAVTTGLLERLDRTELEGVLAHEFSHIGNRDMLVSTAAVVLVGFVAMLADFFMNMAFFGFLGGDDERGGAIGLIIGILIAILAPIAAQLMQLAISRKREFLADASGALLTRYPEGLASALEKIAQNSQPMQKANSATAHLFLSNPFGKERRKKMSVHKYFMSHPPIEERVAALRKQERKEG